MCEFVVQYSFPNIAWANNFSSKDLISWEFLYFSMVWSYGLVNKMNWYRLPQPRIYPVFFILYWKHAGHCVRSTHSSPIKISATNINVVCVIWTIRNQIAIPFSQICSQIIMLSLSNLKPTKPIKIKRIINEIPVLHRSVVHIHPANNFHSSRDLSDMLKLYFDLRAGIAVNFQTIQLVIANSTYVMIFNIRYVRIPTHCPVLKYSNHLE